MPGIQDGIMRLDYALIGVQLFDTVTVYNPFEKGKFREISGLFLGYGNACYDDNDFPAIGFEKVTILLKRKELTSTTICIPSINNFEDYNRMSTLVLRVIPHRMVLTEKNKFRW